MAFDLMVDIETAATTPNALLLTIAAQQFSPFETGHRGQDFYARISIESQPDRDIDDDTLDWWARQDPLTRNEAFAEEDRIPLSDALEQLHRIAWHCDRIWMQGPFFDATILENAYKQQGRMPPWQFWRIRDSRSITALAPDLARSPVSHHALEDCRAQIAQVQDTLAYLKVRSMK